MIQFVTDTIRKYLDPAHEYIFGFADLKGLIDPEFGDFSSAISIGKRLDYRIISSISTGPTKEYYLHYKRINYELSVTASAISSELRQSGMKVRNIEPTVSTKELDTVYSESLRTPFSHKMAATRAGLGWIGKSDLLITREFGPRLRLVTILTSSGLQPLRKPVERSHCGSCSLCLNNCPADAIKDILWDTSVDRDSFFDARKCRNMCREMGNRFISDDARVCGVCLSVCPVGKVI